MKGFLGGVVLAVLCLLLVPIMGGLSPSVAIGKMTSSSLKIFSLLQTVVVVGLIFGCVASLFAWVGKRKREREETDELMREYLRKKLQEEKNNE